MMKMMFGFAGSVSAARSPSAEATRIMKQVGIVPFMAFAPGWQMGRP